MALDLLNMSKAQAAIVLALNAGSSSLKFGLYEMNGLTGTMLLDGEAKAIGQEDGGRLSVSGPQAGELIVKDLQCTDYRQAVKCVLEVLRRSAVSAPDIVGHRIVHGGLECRSHALIDADLVAKIEKAKTFAPLHVPAALAAINVISQCIHSAPQVACLDTAFHATLPDVARVFPLPKELRDYGIERQGFHGLSAESIIEQLGDELPQRLVIAHLGGGASITAVLAGRSIDTSMGLTPLGGVIMGTRPGDLDPGVFLYLIRKTRLNVSCLEDKFERHSGLVGISGVSGDMQRLHDVAAINPSADLAIEMFCYSVAKQIGAMATALGGIDLLVFTGGVGEHDQSVRHAICRKLEWLRHVTGSWVRVMHTDENRRIAYHSYRLACHLL